MFHWSERHAQKLLPTAEVLDAMGSVVPIETTVELVMADKCHDLRKNVFAFVHLEFRDSNEFDSSRTISNRLTQKCRTLLIYSKFKEQFCCLTQR